MDGENSGNKENSRRRLQTKVKKSGLPGCWPHADGWLLFFFWPREPSIIGMDPRRLYDISPGSSNPGPHYRGHFCALIYKRSEILLLKLPYLELWVIANPQLPKQHQQY